MEERAECIMVVPVWTTQVWYNIVLELLIEHPRILPQLEDLMYLVHSKELHPLRESIVMMACRLSGDTSKTLAFRRMLPLSSWRGCTKKQCKTFHKKWFSFCRKRKINQFQISVNHVIEFMTLLYHNNLGYCALNTARASLSALGFVIDGHSVDLTHLLFVL